MTRRWGWVPAAVAVAVLAVVVLAGCSSSGTSRNADGPGGGGLVATVPPSTATTTTTEAPTTTTTRALTPEEERQIAVLAFSVVFDQHRADLAKVLEADINVETVDKLAWDGDTESVVIDVTSRWASPDNQVDGAWELTRGLAVLWDPANSKVWVQPTFVPNLVLVNSGTTYRCGGDFMVKLATYSASRADWETAC